jgi:23S rRNA (adenine2503-C2)-methyltransferase
MQPDSSPLVQLTQPDAGQTLNASRASGAGVHLFGLDEAALSAKMAELNEPPWRGRQLAEAIYRQRVPELDAITTLPRPLRERLNAQGWQIKRPQIAQVFRSVDGTERYLVQGQSHDGQTVETVWMPEGDDGESGDGTYQENMGAPGPGSPRTGLRLWGGDPSHLGTWESDEPPNASKEKISHNPRTRATICVSSQIGCAVNCQFCLTAKLGLQRNLSAGEIAGQVIAVLDRHNVEVGRDRVNLVFMGMGEPFLNYDAFMGAVRLLVAEAKLSPQRMTVSTSGIVPGIERFAQEPPQFRPKLAISLNAPNDAIRSEVMPINRKWPIEAVMEAVRKVQLRPRERITFEYVLLGGVTDRAEDAAQVARLLRHARLPAKVNLIAWNPGPGIAYQMPQPETVETFRNTLINAGIPAYLRKPRGRDIYAACGQLKRTVEG